ncbi:MAG: HD domain-containing protein [bacterium]
MGLIEEAIAFAALAHSGQHRKCTGRPYIWHPLAVGRLLEEHRFSETVIAAGVLHDTIEDTRVTLEQLESRFGLHVAMIVDGCTEPNHRALPWEERKSHTIGALAIAGIEVRAVIAADKIDNLRAIATDRDTIGEAIWERFNRDRQKQEWYYRGIASAIRQNIAESQAIFELLDLHVARVFGAK